MQKELKKLIGKKIKFHYSTHDKMIMNLPHDYYEIFKGTKVIQEDGEWVLYNDKYQYVTYEYAINNLIK